MKILKAQIDGFGRYSGVTFSFDHGLNIIYGPNEAGKSTLQQFLVAMLYGMKKPGRKRAVYLEEEAKYRPWQGSPYGGILWVEQEGVTYRIERSLRKEDEWVRVYRQDTGEEVTKRFAVDSNKELAFAKELTGADRELFVNTLCIGPVDERERASWLRESVRHSQGGAAEELIIPEQSRIRDAEEAIAKRLEAIGTERAPTKPLGLALKQREELIKAYQDALAQEHSQRDARLNAEGEAAEWQEAVHDEQRLRRELGEQLALYLNVQEARRGELAGRLLQLEEALEANAALAPLGIGEDAFRDVQQDFQRLVTAKQETDSYQKRLQVLEEESRTAAQYAAQHKGMDESKLSQMEQTASRLEWYETHTEQGAAPRDAAELEDLEVRHTTAHRSFLLGVAATVIAIPLTFWQLYIGILLLLALFFTASSYVSKGKLAAEIEKWKQGQKSTELEQEAMSAEQERLEASLQQQLADFGVDTPRQFRQKWNDLLKARQQVALYDKQFQWLHGELNRANSERDIIARRVLRVIGGEESQAASYDNDALRREIETWEARFAESRRRKEQALVWEREQADLQHELQLLDKDLQRYVEIADQLGIRPAPPSLLLQETVSGEEVERRYEAWRTADRVLLEKKSTYAAASTRYETLQEGAAAPADLLLEKERAEAALQSIAEEREALLIAQELWSEVKEELYQAIAPRFAGGLSEVTARITGGRYQEVYLDREEAITTISPDSGYTVELSSLSAGTMDQITFALGFALSGWMIPGGEQLPLLLDEPFRRYDDGRLDAVYDVLLEEADNRQIFLFTCREQEVERLQQLGGGRTGFVDLKVEKYGMIKRT
ncbi:AAA domain-containing protein [Tumebacillus sp. BK434]|uniref:ATP-binding protein n=1 Tax=Tumebacillus sp. BK434 TaxID=2512169 RepID=UPI001052D1B9|nr:AAA family ATPase [Tumebacillus sp. BK434]TCP57855.1 AAA domain-containing protein [Tumebacillus sp. BK434]